MNFLINLIIVHLCGFILVLNKLLAVMDRNTQLGLLLIFGLFVLWQVVTSPSQDELIKQQKMEDSIMLARKTKEGIREKIVIQSTESQKDSTELLVDRENKFGTFSNAASGKASDFVLENDLLKVTFSTKGGTIKEVLIKNHHKIVQNADRKDVKEPLRLMSDDRDKFYYALPIKSIPGGFIYTKDLIFEGSLEGNTIRFKAVANNGGYFEQVYTLNPENYLFNYSIKTKNLDNILDKGFNSIKLRWVSYLGKLEKAVSYEKNYSAIYYKPGIDNPKHCSCTSSDIENKDNTPIKWVSFTQQFFNVSLLASENFKGAKMVTTFLDDSDKALKKMDAEIVIPFKNADNSFSMDFYLGPNEFDRLYAMGNNLEDIIAFGTSFFGTINRWVIRPVFNWISQFFVNKGIVIFILTFLVKLSLFYLTYRMIYSQSKMTALKPQIDKLKEKHKDDASTVQMESMKLYREFGVNPLGSCLPMLLQMPIWFALYRFFPAAIEFRQAPFLWADDLSSYDEWIQLPFAIPFGFGSHISLFTILWAISTLAFTFYNSKNMDFSANPAMKWMQYVMPIMFLGFFNSYASGLTAYLLFSNVLNIGQTMATKAFLIDEAKILAQMENHKKKPKKTGGFQDRLQKVLEEQRKIAEQQKNAKTQQKKK
ncbi:MAG: membrane protein insertase YidC [Saprospiraceae bacterium]|nr:membrane protein insertase YidC [Saprospiraceae bacterium]MDP4700078.1 membrane protein insertase YidC [Saprospiraceae bacterium]MDP4811475.1 membrane protein insertase YidC [Saprospiraceae bacterium]MDP4813832.1 membrane protein insertase YidC [Saprospiraceae bacterium]MDP4914436.1 membrane protein insertase YidC [Saprospiraceae bacterium]